MLCKTIKFVDYNGVNREEKHYFNLNETELMRMELGETGGLTEMIKKIIESQDVPKIMDIFEDLIKKSYGIKSADGRQFIKSEEITRAFMQTEAYNKFFIGLITEENAANDFINGLVESVKVNKEANNVVAMPTT